MALKVLLDTFCAASGMLVNTDKSCFLTNNVKDALISRITRSMPFRSQAMATGFKYLGYFIKPSGYLVKDWIWLVDKFEKRISHWAFRLLSLGGRLVLIKAVFTNIPVFWLALVPIPISILRKLKSLIFDFLWGKKGDKKKFHLVEWTTLSKPISQGGWGIKNLEWFSISLRIKSFWHVLCSNGLWFKLISVKYFKKNMWCPGSVISPSLLPVFLSYGRDS